MKNGNITLSSDSTLLPNLVNMLILTGTIIFVQVRVESPDDHDRTREFVWKKSSTIAHLVSQKLLAATRSMLQPPPNASTTNKPVVTLPATPA